MIIGKVSDPRSNIIPKMIYEYMHNSNFGTMNQHDTTLLQILEEEKLPQPQKSEWYEAIRYFWETETHRINLLIHPETEDGRSEITVAMSNKNMCKTVWSRSYNPKIIITELQEFLAPKMESTSLRGCMTCA